MDMKSATGRWVSGDDFFDRESELQVLDARVRAGNHTLLTGQRRMGKTSLLRELGRRLEDEGWVLLFIDVEGATCAEDVIADIAQAVHPIRPIGTRVATRLGRFIGLRWFTENVEEVSALKFRMKIRAGLTAGNWRRHGEQLIRDCATHDHPILLVIDELPIFLKRVLHKHDDGARRVDEFLSWLRGVLQGIDANYPVLIVSGSIGLAPLVQRLGIPDRINYLDPLRLGPWDRHASNACFQRLAASHRLRVEEGVANAVYDAIELGIPHHVQSFFARLREFTIMHERDRVTVADVDTVYRTALLGPSGQNDLVHYQTRLKDGLEDDSYTIAMEILAEAAIQETFTPMARRCLEQCYAPVVDDVPSRIAEVLDVLVHDGYIEAAADGFRFPSRLLKDWWSARFRDHHIPLEQRPPCTATTIEAVR